MPVCVPVPEFEDEDEDDDESEDGLRGLTPDPRPLTQSMSFTLYPLPFDLSPLTFDLSKSPCKKGLRFCPQRDDQSMEGGIAFESLTIFPDAKERRP